MECPVCQNTDISPFATHCHQCGTDVVAFPLLDDLEEQCVDTLKDKVAIEGDFQELLKIKEAEKKQYSKRIGRMYWFLLFFPLMFFWCGKKNIPTPQKFIDNPTLSKKIETLESEKKSLEIKLKEAEEKIASLSVITPKEKFHIVKKGESLSVIALKYFDDKDRWKEIHAYNPHIEDPWILDKGEKVLIKIK